MRLLFWRRAEIGAAAFLRAQGYKVIASNFRVREGEVDLIAWDREILVFVEVKSLAASDAVPEAAVTFRKQRRIVRAARQYIAKHRLFEACIRFDIVAVTGAAGASPSFRLIQNAFT